MPIRMFYIYLSGKYISVLRAVGWQISFAFNSQVHNFQKLKNISLKAVNFFSNKKQK